MANELQASGALTVAGAYDNYSFSILSVITKLCVVPGMIMVVQRLQVETVLKLK